MIKERSDLGSSYDPVDLQLDYWAVVPSSSESGNVTSSGETKFYRKSLFIIAAQPFFLEFL
jgi:hypothetical protein